MANTELVFKMYEYFGKGDMESIKREIFHPDMSWTMPGRHPLSGRMQGVDQVIAFFGELFKAGVRVDNAHFGELDDGTVVEKHMGHAHIGDEEILLPTCTTYGIKDGRIFDVHVHPGDHPTVERFMWATYKLKGIPARLDE